jgi:hypothetical protein
MSTTMTCLIGILVLFLAALAGSPWLFAHRAQRLRRLQLIKMLRIRLRSR